MWQFVQLSDTHLGSNLDGEWNNRFLCTMMPEVISCLRRDLHQVNPDFCLVTGDIANHQTRDSIFAARDFLDSLELDYYPMGGNHDFVIQESREWFLEAYQSRLPEVDTVYSFTHKGLHFCVLDPWWQWRDGALFPFAERNMADSVLLQAPGLRWSIPPHQFAWLRDDLEANMNTSTVVAMHIPAVGIPRRLRRPDLKNAGSLGNGALLIEMLAEFPQVKMVLSGHLHMHIIERKQGVTHVVTGSLPEFPTEYRLFKVYDDRIEIQTCMLSDTGFAERSLISGREFTAGTPADRTAIVSLA